MKVFVNPLPASLSQGIHRVGRAMLQFLPDGWTATDDLDEADFAVFHVIGWGSLEGVVGKYLSTGRPYGVVQYVLRTTEDASAERWYRELWHRAAVVWSYYDLARFCAEGGWYSYDRTKFFFAPMGVDETVFTQVRQLGEPNRRPYSILTSGYIAETEGVLECAQATARLGHTQFHLGPPMKLGAHVHCTSGLTDVQLAACYRACRYVAGLRRIEGFEMPALEGLLCGARPILFDAPHYRDWFGDHGVYVPEVPPEELVPHLELILQGTPVPINTADHAELVARFSWRTLIANWWARVREVHHV